MKLGAGYPMGPFELLDYVGLDTTKFIMDGELKHQQRTFLTKKRLLVTCHVIKPLINIKINLVYNINSAIFFIDLAKVKYYYIIISFIECSKWITSY